MFSWLSDLFERFTDLIPQSVLILPNEGAVRCNMFPFRVWHTTLQPGFYIMWPLFQEIIKVEMTPQVIDLRPQSILRQDGKSIVVSGAVRYRVVNAEKAILGVMDYDESIVALALGTIAKTVTLAGPTVTIDELGNVVRSALAKECSGWGLKIEQVYITDLDRCRSIRLLSNEQRV